MGSALEEAVARAGDETEQIVRRIPLRDLVESPLNPRKTFNPVKLAELAESLKKGQLNPCLVRPLTTGKYELAAGHRRYRAGKLGKLDGLDCFVREMDDATFLDVLVFENGPREDLHPLEEAEGWQLLLTPSKDGPARHSHQSIAARLGYSVSHIYQRLQLLKLIGPAKKLFREDETFTTGHAIEIARLTPKDQGAAVDYVSGSLQDVRPSVRHLRDWIKRELHLDLGRAPFDIKDAQLVPAAGPCINCPKRAGSNPELFGPDIAKETCTDRGCHGSKVEAHFAALRKAVEAKGGKVLDLNSTWSHNRYQAGGKMYDRAKKGDAGAVLGFIAEGNERGKTLYVTPVKASSPSRSSNDSRPDLRAEKARQKKMKIRRRIFDAVRPRLPGTLGLKELKIVAAGYVREMHQDTRKAICSIFGWELKAAHEAEKRILTAIEKLDAAGAARFILCLTVVGECYVSNWGDQGAPRLLALAKSLRVDAAKIEREVDAELKAKAKPKKKAGKK